MAKLTKSEKRALILLDEGGCVYQNGRTGGCYIRAKDFSRPRLGKATYQKLLAAGYVKTGMITDAGRTALGAK